MAKFDVRVGDAFPVETDSARPREMARETERRDDEARDEDDREERRRLRRYRRRWDYVKATLILLVIYAALHVFNGHGPRGLLIAAAIVFGVGFVSWMFRDDDDRPRRRARERGERRPWRDR